MPSGPPARAGRSRRSPAATATSRSSASRPWSRSTRRLDRRGAHLPDRRRRPRRARAATPRPSLVGQTVDADTFAAAAADAVTRPGARHPTCTARPSSAAIWPASPCAAPSPPPPQAAAGGAVMSEEIEIVVNGERAAPTAEVRVTLADFLREQLGLTGTHLGCEHGVCGACTVLVDGAAVRSCLMLAVQARGKEVLTVEGLGDPDELHPLQQALLGEPRVPVRLLHAGLRDDDRSRSSRRTRRPTRPRSARCSRATSAAAPATRASSKACSSPPSAARRERSENPIVAHLATLPQPQRDTLTRCG